MEWIDVKDRPLITQSKLGWVCTEDGDKEFIAAVPYNNVDDPDKTLWWIHHCVIEDGTGLCVVGDDWNEPAGWEIQQVQYWKPWAEPPKV